MNQNQHPAGEYMAQFRKVRGLRIITRSGRIVRQKPELRMDTISLTGKMEWVYVKTL